MWHGGGGNNGWFVLRRCCNCCDCCDCVISPGTMRYKMSRLAFKLAAGDGVGVSVGSRGGRERGHFKQPIRKQAARKPGNDMHDTFAKKIVEGHREQDSPLALGNVVCPFAPKQQRVNCQVVVVGGHAVGQR
jgi:hypothetical protein